MLQVNCMSIVVSGGGIVSGDTSNLEPLINAGVMGFKAFLTHSGIEDFPNTSLKDLEKSAAILKNSIFLCLLMQSSTLNTMG
ncbi:MAG: hypothetical protein IPG90_22050 [Bacteroidetes bacterium]|nr:hypothetical protein [Bacteroidota bacterium]